MPCAPNFSQLIAASFTSGTLPPRAFLIVAILLMFTLNLVIFIFFSSKIKFKILSEIGVSKVQTFFSRTTLVDNYFFVAEMLHETIDINKKDYLCIRLGDGR